MLTAWLLFTARLADAQAFTLVTSSVSENVETAIIDMRNTSGSTQVTSWSTSNGTATAGSDYTTSSKSTFILSNGAQFSASVPIIDDDINEGYETFTITLSHRPLGGTLTSTTLTITIRDNDPPGVTVTPSEVSEGQTAVFTVALNAGWNAITPEDPTFVWSTEDGTATDGQDYTGSTNRVNDQSLVSGSNSAPKTFSIVIAQDNVSDDGETFTIVIEAPQPPGTGAGSIATLRHEVTIREGPVTPPPPVTPDPNRPGSSSADPILAENSNHLVAQSEALLAAQPRLSEYVRNTGIAASDFALRASDGGLESLESGIVGQGFWGEAIFSRSGSRGADGDHAAASLGTHWQVSDGIFLGGMLHFDRTVTKLDGDGRSGEISGEGWMAGPYVVARHPSTALTFEGRLLYGGASNDVEAVVAGAGETPLSGTFDGERWIAQARVEGEYPLGGGTIMHPLADLSHARNAADGFEDAAPQGADLDDAIRTAVSKLQLGAEFEMPLDPARGGLTFRPGLKLEFADRKGVAFGKSDLSSSGRVDLGVDYRLEDGVSLDFQGYYSGIGGGSEFESYGASLGLRMDF